METQPLQVGKEVLTAPVIRTLSTNDKLVELVRVDGIPFVRRSYEGSTVNVIEQVGLSFEDALGETQRIFHDVGIELVASAVLRPADAQDYPVVAVTEYVQGKSLRASTTETKTALATSLGAVLSHLGRYLPRSQFLAKDDGFLVRPNVAGEDRAVLVDIDPYLMRSALLSYEGIKDGTYAEYIGRAADLLWRRWCQPGEREEVLFAFRRALLPLTDELFGLPGGNAAMSLLRVVSMAAGIDPQVYSPN